jgi:protein involved in polysaccharide export with SLBB domain
MIRFAFQSLVFIAMAATHLFGEDETPFRAKDKLELHLGGAPREFTKDFEHSYTVAGDGKIELPLIGKMEVAGFTPMEVKTDLEARLIAAGIFSRPVVIVARIAWDARFVLVNVEGQRPERVVWNPNLKLSGAILGRFSPGIGAPVRAYKLIRNGRVYGTYRHEDLEKGLGTDPALEPGDRVVIAD